MKKVFISHSSKDLVATEKICRYLEQLGVACWYSERDLDISVNYWPDELMAALRSSSTVLLLLTENAILSGEVYNEIVNASKDGKLVIPFYLEKVSLSQKFEYSLRKYEAIDAYSVSEALALELLSKKLSVAKKKKTPPAIEIPVNELLKNEHDCFCEIKNGSYGFGYDKCIINNGTAGWKPSQVYIEEVEQNEFSFAVIGQPELETQYKQFCNSGEYAKMERRGNNRTRWMVVEFYQNENLYISLQKTKWSQTTFWWNQVKSNAEMQRQMATYTFHTQVPFYPNSLCMHLIIETADEKLLCTKVSYNKKNDYAYTIAATIGEQLTETDFSSGTMNNNHFIYDWCKRSILEEFGFTNENYTTFVDETSICVLGVTYEGDIYNFALPVYIKLNLTYQNVLSYFSGCAKNNDEFTDILGYSKEEVLDFIKKAKDPEVEKQFHPSTFLRFLLYLQYRYPDMLEI